MGQAGNDTDLKGMIMLWGIAMFVVFTLCYLVQSVSSGMGGKRGWSLQWLCWLIASLTMLICYLIA